MTGDEVVVNPPSCAPASCTWASCAWAFPRSLSMQARFRPARGRACGRLSFDGTAWSSFTACWLVCEVPDLHVGLALGILDDRILAGLERFGGPDPVHVLPYLFTEDFDQVRLFDDLL